MKARELKELCPIGSVWLMPLNQGKLIVICYIEDIKIGVFVVPDINRDEYYPNLHYLSIEHINISHYFYKRLNEPASLDLLLRQGRYTKNFGLASL